MIEMSDKYPVFSAYMEKIANEMGFETIRKTDITFTIFGLRISSTRLCTNEAKEKVKDKTYIKQFIDEVPRAITAPRPNMVVKPIDGRHGVGIVIGDNLEIPDGCFAEEYIDGDVYRVLILEGRVLSVIREKRPSVIGDGVHTVEELIELGSYESNLLYRPVIGKNVADHIPQKDEVFEVNNIHNLRYGGVREECTDTVDSSVTDLALKAFSKIDDLFVSGIDIIQCKKTGKVYLLELNHCPGMFGHYYPNKGEAKDVLRDIVKAAILIRLKQKIIAVQSITNGRYKVYNQYMEAIARGLGFKTKRITNMAFTVNGLTFTANNHSSTSVYKLTKDKKFVKSLFPNDTPKDILKPSKNMILKPRFGTGGIGIKVGDFLPIPKDYIAEEFVEGDGYRVLVVNSTAIAILKQRSAYVIGNGVDTVEDLVNKVEYNEPYSYKPRIGYPIHKKIPKNGERVRLHFLQSRTYGGTVTECTKNAPKKIVNLAIKAVNAIKGLKMGGVDLMYDSVNDKAYLLEVNALPHLYAHYNPQNGKPIDVLKLIVEHALK